MYVIGTAGHVDHGKTKLVEALTGIDTDRLPEEKKRGLTIDLGFAHFMGADGRPIGVIDVPGHERFIRNMVAGAWSVDCALLVVAANEGWMPQSTDHTRVLSCVGIPRVIVVITKGDLVDGEIAGRVQRSAVERCADIGGWAPPSIVVSAAQNRNIEELRKLIQEELASQPRREPGSPYLYVDRVFRVKGAGMVVTGSLKGGALARGADAIVLPQQQKVRIRGIQSYYHELDRAEPVSRVALNLPSEKMEDLTRGCCVVAPGSSVRSETEFIARIRRSFHASPADTQSGAEPLRLRSGSEVEIALGTGHQHARVYVLSNPTLIRVVLTAPMPMMWNQRFLAMQPGGSRIIGGGSIIWFGQTSRATRNRLSTVSQELRDQPADLLHLQVMVNGITRCSRDQARILAKEPGFVVLGSWVFDETRLADWQAEILERVSRSGQTKMSDLAREIRLETAPLAEICEELGRSGKLLVSRGVLSPADASPEKSLSALGKRLLADLRNAGSAGIEPRKLRVSGSLQELRNLARLDLAVSLDGDIFYATEAYDALAQAIIEGQKSGSTFTIGQAREKTALSRKFLIPLLNRMESDGLVRREGDVRRIL
jgi:selenocysteine-specific elongation factor